MNDVVIGYRTAAVTGERRDKLIAATAFDPSKPSHDHIAAFDDSAADTPFLNTLEEVFISDITSQKCVYLNSKDRPVGGDKLTLCGSVLNFLETHYQQEVVDMFVETLIADSLSQGLVFPGIDLFGMIMDIESMFRHRVNLKTMAVSLGVMIADGRPVTADYQFGVKASEDAIVVTGLCFALALLGNRK